MKITLFLVLGLVALLFLACNAVVTQDQPTEVPAQAVMTATSEEPTDAPIMLAEPTDTPTAASQTRTPIAGAATRTPTRPRATPANSGFPTIRMDQLPKEARQTIALIQKGGPFPYRQDGIVFENREGLLPNKPSGYYHEYTVVTPGSPDRGARRIITGQSGEMYYTDDHYASFKRIIE